MAARTKIEWADHTFNPWWGCAKVSPACDNCYAEAWARRLETQKFAAKRIPHLLALPCARRFLSCEPLLGPVDLEPWQDGLDWVIAGGESGPSARRTQLDWVRDLRDQCNGAGVAFHFKQWGSWRPSERTMLGETVVSYARHHKTAGRELDGRTWDELPRGYASGTEEE